MGTSWGAAGYKLQKDASAEQRKLEKEASKKGLWGSIGSTLGSFGAMALGISNPILAGLMAGGMSTAGGLIGAGTQKISGGKFHKGARSDMKSTITQDIIKGGLQTGLTAGMTKGVKGLGKTGVPDTQIGLSGNIATTTPESLLEGVGEVPFEKTDFSSLREIGQGGSSFQGYGGNPVQFKDGGYVSNNNIFDLLNKGRK